MHDSPARRDDHHSVTGSTKVPLAFCATRWIEDKTVADRFIELWPNLKKVMEFWVKLPKSMQPKNKSYDHLKSVLYDPLLTAKLGFFSYFAEIFKPFLTLYQTDEPMLPYLNDGLYNLLKNVFSIIIKPAILAECVTANQIMKIDLKKSSNLLDGAGINSGFVAATLIKKLKRKDEITQAQLKAFYEGVKLFVTATITSLLAKIPISSKIVRNACIFNPLIMNEANVDLLIMRLKVLVGYLVDSDWLDAQVGDKIIAQYSLFLQSNKMKIASFKRASMRLDEFFSRNVW